ncbi:MAG: hypothetical protein ACE5IY_22270 [bacterium]
MTWLYAAIRPRFGAGPRTAIISGVACWVLLELLGFAGSSISTGMYPGRMVLTAIIGSLVYFPVAAVAGAWLYKEEGSET